MAGIPAAASPASTGAQLVPKPQNWLDLSGTIELPQSYDVGNHRWKEIAIMEIPVTGFVHHSEGGDEHSHKLYITSWNGRPMHVHEFSGITSVNVGHRHEYAGTTEPAPSGVQHTHHYHAKTTFNAGHSHVIRGMTGPAIPLPGGGHIHMFEGVTTVNGSTPHAHHYEGRTGNEISC